MQQTAGLRDTSAVVWSDMVLPGLGVLDGERHVIPEVDETEHAEHAETKHGARLLKQHLRRRRAPCFTTTQYSRKYEITAAKDDAAAMSVRRCRGDRLVTSSCWRRRRHFRFGIFK